MSIFGFSSCKCDTCNYIPDPMNGVMDYTVIVFDSCEYIKYRTHNGYYGVAHKGNCKYCKERTLK